MNTAASKDATGLSRGVITFACYTDFHTHKTDATALRRGVSRSLLNSRKREAPRDKPVASGVVSLDEGVAANVSTTGQARGISSEQFA
jgi:hypothetical protein